MIPTLSFILDQINTQINIPSVRVKRAASENTEFNDSTTHKRFKEKEFSSLDYLAQVSDILQEYNLVLQKQLYLKKDLKEKLQGLNDDEVINKMYRHPSFLETLEKLESIVDKVSRLTQLIIQCEKEKQSEMDVDSST